MTLTDTSDVLDPVHDFEMVRVETRPVLAEVVDLASVGDRSSPHRPGKPVGEDLFLSVVRPEQPVPAVDASRGGFPTPCVGDAAVVQEPVFVAVPLGPEFLRDSVWSVGLVEPAESSRPDRAWASVDCARAGGRGSGLDGCGVGVLPSLLHPVVCSAESSGVRGAGAVGDDAGLGRCHGIHNTYERKVI